MARAVRLSSVRLSSVTFLRSAHRVELFDNILHHLMAQFVLEFWAKLQRGSTGSCKLNKRGYEKLALFDQYLALFRKR